MTRTELIAQLALETGFTKKDIGELLDALAGYAQSALASGEAEKLVIPGVVTLKRQWVKARPAHPGTNPRTGEPMHVSAQPAHFKVKATPAATLKKAVAARKRPR